MKLINHIQERYKERNRFFLLLDVICTLVTLYFATRILFIVIPGLTGSNVSDDSPLLLLGANMILFLGLSHAVRVVEMIVTGKRRYFALTLVTTIIILGIAAIELYWLFNY